MVPCITADGDIAIVTSWKCLVGVAPATPELGERDMMVVHNDHYSFLFLTQPDKTFFFVFFRLQQPFTWPHRQRYTDEDAETLAASVASHPLCETLVFGELWKKRIRGSLISLEEGVLQHWSHERIVLVGDSVHKVTPNIALGGNSAMESTAVLCNHLQRTLASHAGAKVSRATLAKTFANYQREREGRMKDIMALSSLITRVQAWDNILFKGLATWIFPYQPDYKLTNQMAELIRRAPKLDYVPVGKDMFKGRVKWIDEEEGESIDISSREKGTTYPGQLFKYFIGVVVAILIYTCRISS